MAVASIGKVWQAENPDYENVVRQTFDGQMAMKLIGATLGEVKPGVAGIHLPIHDMLMTHIPGIVHGGLLGMLCDASMGYAALTLAEPNQTGITSHYTIEMLAPAIGDRLLARGEVVRRGRRAVVARADVTVFREDESKLLQEKVIATALGELLPL